MNRDTMMDYEPVEGDVLLFQMPVRCERTGDTISRGERGLVRGVYADNNFIVSARNDAEPERVVHLLRRGGRRIPCDLMCVELIERVPTPVPNCEVDVDAVIASRELEDIPGCHDVSIKAATLHAMCKEIRRFRMTMKQETEE